MYIICLIRIERVHYVFVCALDPAGPTQPLERVTDRFWLTVSRLLGYKRLDVLLSAAARRPDEQFVVIGDGPHAETLRRDSPGNVHWAGARGDDELRWAYRNCRGLIGTSEEDFGLTPLEAASFGVPSLVPRARGYLDHVVEGESGLFHDGTVQGLMAGLDEMAASSWASDRIRGSVARHQPAVFTRRIVDIVEDAA